MCRGVYDCGDFDCSPREMSKPTTHKLVSNITLHLKKKQTQNQKENRNTHSN